MTKSRRSSRSIPAWPAARRSSASHSTRRGWPRRASYAFLALPHTASMAIVPELRQRGVRVIDLSADYRLNDAQVYADWYGHVHTDAKGLDEAVYGLPELFREQIPDGRADRQPGLLHVDEHPGAGTPGRRRSDRARRHHHRRQERRFRRGPDAQARPITSPNATRTSRPTAWAGTVIRPRSIRCLPRSPEAAAITSRSFSRPTSCRWTEESSRRFTHSPKGRSPSNTSCSIFIADIMPAARSSESSSTLPATKDSAFTNFCDITVRVVRGRIVVLACLDNLIKGAAGVAVQNLNLMLGCAEETALL